MFEVSAGALGIGADLRQGGIPWLPSVLSWENVNKNVVLFSALFQRLFYSFLLSKDLVRLNLFPFSLFLSSFHYLPSVSSNFMPYHLDTFCNNAHSFPNAKSFQLWSSSSLAIASLALSSLRFNHFSKESVMKGWERTVCLSADFSLEPQKPPTPHFSTCACHHAMPSWLHHGFISVLPHDL